MIGRKYADHHGFMIYIDDNTWAAHDCINDMPIDPYDPAVWHTPERHPVIIMDLTDKRQLRHWQIFLITHFCMLLPQLTAEAVECRVALPSGGSARVLLLRMMQQLTQQQKQLRPMVIVTIA